MPDPAQSSLTNRIFYSSRAQQGCATPLQGYGNGLIFTGGVSYPGSSEFATSVGGTTLARDGSARGWTETAWAGSTPNGLGGF